MKFCNSNQKTPTKGYLLLEQGPLFEGYFFGKKKNSCGEIVFTTGMVGYPETLTDPSFQGQILVLTYPLVGNYGVPSSKIRDEISEAFESDYIHLRGLIVADYSFEHSHFAAIKSLDSWLEEQSIPALYGVDTRALTKYLREHGVCPGKIVTDRRIHVPSQKPILTPVEEVSCKSPIEYRRGPTRVVLIDCGVKNSIIRSLLARDITVVRVPWNHDLSQETYDGIVVSNGPGDPTECTETILQIRKALSQRKPIFGICLGNQILALAAGASTYKLPFGHRGQNQPCVDVRTSRNYITSQNHGYAIDDATLPKDWSVWFRNLNDGTNEGIRHTSKPFFSVQFHPEAMPGPHDTTFLFDEFIHAMKS